MEFTFGLGFGLGVGLSLGICLIYIVKEIGLKEILEILFSWVPKLLQSIKKIYNIFVLRKIRIYAKDLKEIGNNEDYNNRLLDFCKELYEHLFYEERRYITCYKKDIKGWLEEYKNFDENGRQLLRRCSNIIKDEKLKEMFENVKGIILDENYQNKIYPAYFQADIEKPLTDLINLIERYETEISRNEND